MSREAPVEDAVLTPEKLSDILAEATDTDPEEIERGVAEFEIHASGRGRHRRVWGAQRRTWIPDRAHSNWSLPPPDV